MVANMGFARQAAGENDVVYRSRVGRAGQRAALVFGGITSTALSEHGNGHVQHRELAERGLTVLHTDWDGTHWGRDSAQTKVGLGKTYIQAAPWSAASGTVLLSGGSMGGLLALLWSLANPTLVGAVAVAIPAVSPIDIHDNDRGGLAAGIETAYGGLAGWNAAKASHDALTRAAEFASLGVPLKVWSSFDDAICTRATHTAFGAASGAELVDMGSVGHTVPDAAKAEMADFLKAYA